MDGGFESIFRSWAPAQLASITGMDLTHSVVEGDESAAEITLQLEKEVEPANPFVVVVSDHAADADGLPLEARIFDSARPAGIVRSARL